MNLIKGWTPVAAVGDAVAEVAAAAVAAAVASTVASGRRALAVAMGDIVEAESAETSSLRRWARSGGSFPTSDALVTARSHLPRPYSASSSCTPPGPPWSSLNSSSFAMFSLHLSARANLPSRASLSSLLRLPAFLPLLRVRGESSSRGAQCLSESKPTSSSVTQAGDIGVPPALSVSQRRRRRRRGRHSVPDGDNLRCNFLQYIQLNSKIQNCTAKTQRALARAGGHPVSKPPGSDAAFCNNRRCTGFATTSIPSVANSAAAAATTTRRTAATATAAAAAAAAATSPRRLPNRGRHGPGGNDVLLFPDRASARQIPTHRSSILPVPIRGDRLFLLLR